jgi:hypothetical protein
LIVKEALSVVFSLDCNQWKEETRLVLENQLVTVNNSSPGGHNRNLKMTLVLIRQEREINWARSSQFT